MHAASESMNAYRAGRKAFESGDFDHAAIAFRWASGLDPDNPIYSHAAAMSVARVGDHDKATQLYLRAAMATRRTLGEAHPFMLVVVSGLVAHCRDGEVAANGVAEMARRALARADPGAVAQSGDRTLQALAVLGEAAGHLDAAIPFFRAATAFRRDRYGDRHSRTAFCIAALADIYRRTGDAGKAERLLERAVSAGVAVGAGGTAA